MFRNSWFGDFANEVERITVGTVDEESGLLVSVDCFRWKRTEDDVLWLSTGYALYDVKCNVPVGSDLLKRAQQSGALLEQRDNGDGTVSLRFIAALDATCVEGKPLVLRDPWLVAFILFEPIYGQRLLLSEAKAKSAVSLVTEDLCTFREQLNSAEETFSRALELLPQLGLSVCRESVQSTLALIALLRGRTVEHTMTTDEILDVNHRQLNTSLSCIVTGLEAKCISQWTEEIIKKAMPAIKLQHDYYLDCKKVWQDGQGKEG